MNLLRKAKYGEVYIGVIIALGIFIILAQTVVTLIFSVYDLVIYNKSRTTARYLATRQIEYIKNLSFDDIGTVGGIPQGVIEPQATRVLNGLSYQTFTTVENVDDPFDQTGTNDDEPVDYKKIQVIVSWGGVASRGASTIKMVTQISPRNDIEVGGGVIDITVSDSVGNPVQGAIVTISAPTLTPPVNTTLSTDMDGKLIIPGAAACTQCYEISVTKENMSTDKTYGVDEVLNPVKGDITVIDEQVSEVNFTIDRLGTLTINSTSSRENGFLPAPNQQFILRGTKIIGTDAESNLIYKYGEILTTDGSGTRVLTNMEWDAYHIIIPTGAGWDVSGTNPLLPMILNPGEEKTISFSVETGSDHRLLVQFKTNENIPIASVEAILKENSTQLEASSSSGLVDTPDFGQIFFDNLSQTTYTLYATISGYLNYTNEIIVNDYTKEQAILIAE